MIKDRSRNSSIAVASAMCIIVGSSVYSNSTHDVPKISNYVYEKMNTTPKHLNIKDNSSSINLSESYIKNKKGDSMKNEAKNNKIKSINIVSAHRTNNQFNDLGYYEYNEVENLDIAPRSKVKVKAKIKSAKRSELKLM